VVVSASGHRCLLHVDMFIEACMVHVKALAAFKL
jgi:hypothetical protein